MEGLPKVLVVDDHVENLVAMRHVLKRIDSEVVCVESGNEALRELIKSDYSVVLMDVQMPEMNGFEAAELIRNNEATKQLPIIFLTAINKEKKYVKQGYRLGAVDYLFKPFDPEVLRYKVSVFVELNKQKEGFISLAKKNKLILDSVSEGVIGLDVKGRVMFSNPAASEMLLYDKNQLSGIPATLFLLGAKNKEWVDTDLCKNCLDSKSGFKKNLRLVNRMNGQFPVECNVTAMRDSKNKLEGFVLVFEDITSKLETEQQLIKMAEHDPLTGLANRRLFYRLLPQSLAKSKRTGHQVALLFMDIDHFKTINDSLGHTLGDILLSEFSSRLKQCVRESDIVVRLSGDEFTVILEGDFNKSTILKLVKNISSRLAEPYSLNGNSVRCTVSIGIALSGEVSTETNELIRAADIAMYNAKENGRNNFQFYDEKLNQKASIRSSIENGLKSALKRNEFSLNYQPKINLLSNKVVGVESLIRWKSQELGEVSPSRFIPIAEDCGIIDEIGLWVLKESCAQFKLWRKRKQIEKDFCISINISTRELNNPNFLMSLEKILKSTQVAPLNIDIEITESALMSNPEAAVPLLRVLSQMGMSISIDDFGTGYSSLNYLRILPINYLKVDQSFIKNLFKDKNSYVITQSIINLAHNLGLQVVAEGVENNKQLEFLKENKCEIGQGYLFGKPCSKAEIVSIIDKFNNS